MSPEGCLKRHCGIKSILEALLNLLWAIAAPNNFNRNHMLSRVVDQQRHFVATTGSDAVGRFVAAQMLVGDAV